MTRLRDLGVSIGALPTGAFNAITDVPGVWVGHTTVIRDEPSVVRTGVTVIVPRENTIWTDYAFCAWHSFNGNGELTGIPWVEESGLLGSVVALTNTHQVGMVRDALVRYSVEHGFVNEFILPVVTETYDGWLSDAASFPLVEADVFSALAAAGEGPVAEGNVGGGTGMICHEFKGGIGTSSRVVDLPMHSFTVGVLVQANYGARSQLRLDGRPLGRLIDYQRVPPPWPAQPRDGSIIVVIATDAPLLAEQCRRLARRATVGLARVGGVGHNGSGDIFFALATGNSLPAEPGGLFPLKMLPHEQMDRLFVAVADATEEAILNALCAAETMTGREGRTAHALPVQLVAELLEGERRDG
ncbi:MAG TPA: P1 family peptidase [Acidimicrobiia bacterium]|nr:P1 family peptidase [Acidimicrobiia bacterium]